MAVFEASRLQAPSQFETLKLCGNGQNKSNGTGAPKGTQSSPGTPSVGKFVTDDHMHPAHADARNIR